MDLETECLQTAVGDSSASIVSSMSTHWRDRSST